MALARLYRSAEYIGAAYAPSANGAMRELERLSGVTVEVLAPVGGARTKKQCNDLGTPWWISDHWEGRGRALDVNNRSKIITGLAMRQRISFAAAVSLYYNTWAKFGWYNRTTDWRPFPEEPWHMANHSTIPAGTGGVPLPGTPPKPPAPTIENEDNMATIYHFDINSLGADITADTAPRTPGVDATVAGATHTVNAQATYFQEHPGDALKQLTPGAKFLAGATADYREPVGASMERAAFVQTGGKVLRCNGADLAALIELRGLTS